jgi:hypothetical protein
MTTEPGPSDYVISSALERALADLDAGLIEQRPLDPADAPHRLARHAADEQRSELARSGSANDQAERITAALRRLAVVEGDEAAVAEADLGPALLVGGPL